MKRVLDIILSVLLLAVLGVPMLLLALAVRLSSPGPALFRQRRAGWRGRAFVMLKFRTMRPTPTPMATRPTPATTRA